MKNFFHVLDLLYEKRNVPVLFQTLFQGVFIGIEHIKHFVALDDNEFTSEA